MKTFREYIQENEYYHVTPTKNVRSILKNGLKPSVGKSSEKMGETPSTFLFKNEADAHDAVMNWLGDEHDEPLTMLKVNLPKHIKAHETEAGYERQVHEHIPAECISHHEDLG
jgi:hypothetical protein